MSVYFFISTGRCGTTWLCRTLRDNYKDLAVTVQEPVKKKKSLLNYYLKTEEKRIRIKNRLPNNELEEIIESIKEINEEGKKLIWTGWDCYALLPILIKEFPNSKIIYLDRNKENCVKSLKKTRFYKDTNNTSHPNPKFCKTLVKKSKDFEENAQSWYYDEIREYSKYIREKYPKTPFLNFRSEYIFDNKKKELKELIKFLELPWKEEVYKASFEKGRMLWPNSRGIRACINPKIVMK